MIEKFRAVSTLHMTGIRIDEDEGARALEHLSYRIIIETTGGDIVITGNHDCEPAMHPSKLLEEPDE